MKCAVYVDFDGTITPDEPTDALFDKFADPAWRQIEKDWQEGRASSRDCMERQVALLRATPSGSIASSRASRSIRCFLRLCACAGGMARVSSWCRTASIALWVTYCVRLVWSCRILPIGWCGRVVSRWSLQFPYYRDDCRATMGNCKCAHRREGASTLEITVGDGRSDFCMAERSKVVLAKGQLAAHCTRMGVPHLQMREFLGRHAADRPVVRQRAANLLQCG